MKPARHVSESQSDVMDPARAAAFQITLGHAPDIVDGSPLPPFFNPMYLWSPQPPLARGRVGHPKVGGGGLITDMGLPRRMWAGGRLEFSAPLIAGRPATRVSVVEQAVHKHGRTGPLGFVTLRHEFRQTDTQCLTEWQDLVYREDPDPEAPQPPASEARGDETDAREMTFSTTLLFRYSALTFNGHRIHYDQEYARDVEGYSGLVVHGPLLAQNLMLMAEALMGSLSGFSFRAASALMHTEIATFCRNGTDLWVRGADGRLVMSATATLAS
jgi:3-methylfumaryl-CoA hydratase